MNEADTAQMGKAAASANETRAILIDVAEEQFSKNGLSGTSLRAIGRLAGCANTGAVRYHFGDRDGLIDAIFNSRLGPIELERGAAMARMQSRADPPGVRDLLDILMRPVERQRSRTGKRSYAAFLAGLDGKGEMSVWKQHGEHLAASSQIIQELRSQVPHLSDEQFHRRLSSVSVMIWHRLGVLDREHQTEEPGPSDETEFDDLLNMASAALTAAA